VLAANDSGSAVLGCTSLCRGQGIDLGRYLEGSAEGSPDEAFPELMRAWASAGLPLSRPVRLRPPEGRPVRCRAEGLAVTSPTADGLSRVLLHLVPAVGTAPLSPLADPRGRASRPSTTTGASETSRPTAAAHDPAVAPPGTPEAVRRQMPAELVEPDERHVGKMEAMGNLAAGIAHDFNNLLTVMKVEVELILEDDNVPAHAVDSLLSAHAAMLRAESLIDGLLAFSRRQLMHTARTDLGALLERAIPRVRAILGDKELVVGPTTDPLPLLVDAEQMEIVLLALVRNAVEASTDGSRVTIRTRRQTLDETFVEENEGSQEGDYAVLEVEDHGTGIAPDVEERMFEPFFTTKGRGYGRGLGLAQAFGIVKMLGGYLKVLTEVGEGSRFIVYLPLHDGSASG
jgi:signal transduction histidine kinase